jgi:peptide/nickel transport system substrate-binding protein
MRCYGGDVKQNRQQGRALMEKLGYGPSKRLKVKVTTRELPVYRDPSVILIDQLKEVYVDGDFEPVETAAYFPKKMDQLSGSRPVAPAL